MYQTDIIMSIYLTGKDTGEGGLNLILNQSPAELQRGQLNTVIPNLDLVPLSNSKLPSFNYCDCNFQKHATSYPIEKTYHRL